MSRKSPIGLVFDIPDSLLKRAEFVAARDGTDATTWMQKQFEKWAKHAIGDGEAISPKQTAAELNVSVWTVYREMKNGAFPHMYYVNDKVVRIPRTDIEEFRKSRTRAVG